MPKREHSGRKKVPVAALFNEVGNRDGTPRVECQFCSLQLSKNGSRMVDHLKKKCLRCPADIKEKYFPDIVSSLRKMGDIFRKTNSETEGKSKAEGSSPSPFSAGSSAQHSVKTFLDSMGRNEQERADELLCRAIYTSGAPLSMAENQAWLDFMKFIRPAYNVPSRHMVSNPLLEKEYKDMQTKVTESIAAAKSLAIITDGWSNIRRDAIVNVVVATPKPLLFKVIETSTERHTAEYFAKVLGEVIEELGPQKVFGIVTDNAANMKAAWNLLGQKYCGTNLYTYGCIAHSLNLIFSDLKKLPTLNAFTTEAVKLINGIRNTQVLNAAILKKQDTDNPSTVTLKLPVKTRWGSLVHCFESLLANKKAIKELAIDENLATAVKKNDGLSRNALNEVFWDRAKSFCELLKPIADAITILESDVPRLSKCVGMMTNLQKAINDSLAKSPFSKAEEQKIKDIMQERVTFALCDVHRVANLLDPCFMGSDLTEDEKTDATEEVFKAATKMENISELDVLAELAQYRAKEGLFQKKFLWEVLPNVSPTVWWSGFCSGTALAKVAVRFLELPASSASCERTFSTYANVHTKKRNRLTNERAAKLVYISHNYKLLDTGLSASISTSKGVTHVVESSEEELLCSEEEEDSSESDAPDT